jgi:HEAT repeat protein
MQIANTMIEKLIQALDQPDGEARARAREQLVQIGPDVVEPLIAAMQTENLRLSWQAAVTLGHIADQRWIGPMQAALRSSNVLLGQAAVTALEETLQGEAVDSLLDALAHCRLAVQMPLVNALERLGDSRAVEPLCGFLETTGSPELRYTIIQALGKLGDPSLIPLIEKFEHDPNHHVRDRVVIALDRLTNMGNL